MPTVGVSRDNLFRAIGREFTEAEFDELCFQFGIELDEVTTDVIAGATVVIYKFDIPANRYDLLCLEGLSRALRIFMGIESPPTFSIVETVTGKRESVLNKSSTSEVRPFVVAAILRGITFDSHTYKSFIELQDKLHQNICRKRTLVAIGTHDYDTLEGPFTYEALLPEDIKFKPLVPADRGEFNAKDLLDFYNTEPSVKHLKPYTGIIYDSPLYPVVLDAKRRVCSLPPVINSYHSRISQDTKNIFIECTATDLTKANIVLDTMVTMFSHLCLNPFTVEPVAILSESDSSDIKVTPILETRNVEVNLSDLRGILGMTLTPEKICQLCSKMQLGPAFVDESRDVLQVTVPPTRSDVLHAVDVIEDVAIAYGYNALPLRNPVTYTVGASQPLNALCDLLREEVARAGYTELLTHGLCDYADINAVTRKNGNESGELVDCPVALGEGDYEVVRTTLLPGILKTLQHNRSMSVKDGVRLFEVSEVVLLDDSSDTGARNVRRICALYAGPTAGFEIIHGLVDRILQLFQIVPAESYAGSSASKATGGVIEGGPWREGLEYFVRPSNKSTFFPGRCADVMLRKITDKFSESVIHIGTFGILHPEVLQNFDIGDYPASILEIDLEPLA